MQQKSLFKKFFSWVKIAVLIIILSAVIFVVLYFLNNLFLISQIEIIKPDITHPPLRSLELIKHKNILFISENDIAKMLSDQNPFLQSVSVVKKLPNKLLINLEIYKPIAYLKVNSGIFALASDGKILYKNHEESPVSPIIQYYQLFDYSVFNPGDKLTYSDITISLQLLEKSSELGLTVDSVDINGLDMIAFNLKDKKILFTTEKDELQQAYELETIIRQFKIKGQEFKNLDLRFYKPVVTF